ncbi:MAG: DUF1320 family protein [Verrucomicrobiales bacterium]|jgi:hypothetical protein|nr:DUF1320 family protein [Verrucomicrobiales bacterium]
MSWLTLTTDDVLTRLAAPELDAFRTAATAPGQADPLTEIIASVCDRVRGYVAACARNRLGPAGTIPARLVGPALAVIRYEAATRLPRMGKLIDQLRVTEYEKALQLFRDVAACDYAVEDPADVDGTQSAGAVRPVSHRRRLEFDRRAQDGI